MFMRERGIRELGICKQTCVVVEGGVSAVRETNTSGLFQKDNVGKAIPCDVFQDHRSVHVDSERSIFAKKSVDSAAT